MLHILLCYLLPENVNHLVWRNVWVFIRNNSYSYSYFVSCCISITVDCRINISWSESEKNYKLCPKRNKINGFFLWRYSHVLDNKISEKTLNFCSFHKFDSPSLTHWIHNYTNVRVALLVCLVQQVHLEQVTICSNKSSVFYRRNTTEKSPVWYYSSPPPYLEICDNAQTKCGQYTHY